LGERLASHHCYLLPAGPQCCVDPLRSPSTVDIPRRRLDVSFGPGAAVLRIRLERQDLPTALPRYQLTSSISLGRQLLSKNDSSGL